MANIEIENFLENCLDVIEKGHKFISAKRDGFQLKSDIDSGYMRKNGILLDSKTGIRKFAFENYELFVLNGNPFHIEAIFSLDTDRFKNRAYAILCLTVVNIIHRINNQIENLFLQKEIESLLKQAYLIWDKLIADWKINKIHNNSKSL